MCAVLIAHGPQAHLVCLSFLTPGVLFSFIFVFDPSNVFEAFDVMLDPELCAQSAEEALMSAQLLCWLEISELFLHSWS